MAYVKQAQARAHSNSLSAQALARENFIAYKNITKVCIIMNSNADAVLEQWRGMRDFLVYKFADGAIYEDPSFDSAGTATALGYPNWWLQDVGYQNGPPP